MANPQTPPASTSEPGGGIPGVEDGRHTPGGIFGANVSLPEPGKTSGNQEILIWNNFGQVWEPVKLQGQLSDEGWTALVPEAKVKTTGIVPQVKRTLGIGTLGLQMAFRGAVEVEAAQTLAAGEAVVKPLGAGFLPSSNLKLNFVTGTAAAMIANRLVINNTTGAITLEAAVPEKGIISFDGLIVPLK